MEGNSYSSLGTYGDMVSMHVVSMQLPSFIHSLPYSSKKHLARIYHDLDTVRGTYTCVISVTLCKHSKIRTTGFIWQLGKTGSEK